MESDELWILCLLCTACNERIIRNILKMFERKTFLGVGYLIKGLLLQKTASGGAYLR